MMLTSEQLANELDSEYLNYCKSNPTAKTIIACHTTMFKQVDDCKVRKLGYWWLRYNYGFCSYYQNHKIPNSLVISVNQALIKTVQTGYTKENLLENLASAFRKHEQFFNYVYECHLEDQRRFQNYSSDSKFRFQKKEDKDYTNILAVITVICICIVIAFFYVR